MASRSLNVVITGDSKGFNRALNDADRNTGKFQQNASRSFGAVGGAAGLMATAVGTAAVAAGVSIVKTAQNFEKAMAEVKAVSGATQKEMDLLSKAALDLGASTGMGATKAAEGIAELAKGGVSAQKIIGGGLKGALSLAAAGGLEVADAAETTANALNLFAMKGEQATHVADAFATAANATTADVADFGMALSQGGAAAKAAGLSFDEATVFLEALAASGVKGADAGTSMKSALTQIANPTKEAAGAMKKLHLEFFTADGDMRSLTDISQMLRTRLGGLTNQQRLQAAATVAGTDGMRALLSLYDAGPSKLSTFEKGLRKQGSAADVAREKQAGLAGSMQRLRASVETLSIELGTKLLPSLTKGVDRLNKFTGEMRKGDGAGGSFSQTMREISPYVLKYANAAVDAVKALGPYVNATRDAVKWTREHKTVLQLLDAATRDPIENLKLIKDVLNGVASASKAVVSAVSGVASAFGKVKHALGAGLIPSLRGSGDGLGRIKDQVSTFGGAGLSGGNGLMGAKQILAPFASMAGRFGLHTSSGARPGAITSSGNVSWHSSGNAIDEAGTPAGMLGYFRYLKNTFGSRLRELIYTPGGVGIKDGRPYQYTGQVAADHYDHVHVAFTGDGHGRKAGTGDGLGQLKSLWTRAGGSSSAANTAAAIAMAESGGNPGASNRNTDGSIDRGLWQINSVHGAQSTFDRLANARAAVSISSNGHNWNPWTVYKTGAYRRFLSGSSGSSGGSSSGGSGGSGGSSAPRTGSSGGPPPTVDNKAIYGVTESTVPTFANTFGTPPVKGRGDFPGAPHKGGATLNPDGTDPRQVARDLAAAGPSEYDYLDAALAEAEATATTSDDNDVLGKILAYRQRAYQGAVATGDPRQIATARRDLTSAQTALDDLNKTIQDNTDALKSHTDALTAVQTELQRQTDVATSIQSTEAFQLKRYLADVLSGEFGRGIVARSFTAGTGVEQAF